MNLLLSKILMAPQSLENHYILSVCALVWMGWCVCVYPLFIVPWLHTHSGHTPLYLFNLFFKCTSSTQCSNLHLSRFSQNKIVYGCTLRIIHETLKMAILSCFLANKNWIDGIQVKAHLCATTQNEQVLQSFHACMKS
jgi:hypothetical protein